MFPFSVLRNVLLKLFEMHLIELVSYAKYSGLNFIKCLQFDIYNLAGIF